MSLITPLVGTVNGRDERRILCNSIERLFLGNRGG